MYKILVAEDDEALNRLVCACLTDSGYEPYACFNGQAAADALENETFDMVISDIMMPILDGFSLARKVRETD